MIQWATDDLLQQIAPKLVGALLVLAAAHSDVLQRYGISVNWATFGGKATTATLLLVGMLAGHHTVKAIVPPAPPPAPPPPAP
jgi:hypothetical protein